MSTGSFSSNLNAFFHASYTVPDIQVQIPEKGHEALNAVFLLFTDLAGEKDQQVNVGMWVQLLPAVTAHGQQGDIRAPCVLLPGIMENAINKACALIDKASHLLPFEKAIVKLGVCGLYGIPENRKL